MPDSSLTPDEEPYEPPAAEHGSAMADDGAEINAISIKAVEVYQNQMLIVENLWSYFSQYSGMLVLLGLGLAMFRGTSAVHDLSTGFLFVPAGLYVVFAIGNHKALSLTLDELHMVRSIATAQTRLKFTSVGKGGMLGFHLLMALGALVLYGLSCWYSRGNP